MERIDIPKDVRNLCIFLKLLYEQTKLQYVKINLNSITKNMIPNNRLVIKILLYHKIISVQNLGTHGRLYKWNTIEPSKHMAEAIISQTKQLNKNAISKHRLKCKINNITDCTIWGMQLSEIGLIY